MTVSGLSRTTIWPVVLFHFHLSKCYFCVEITGDCLTLRRLCVCVWSTQVCDCMVWSSEMKGTQLNLGLIKVIQKTRQVHEYLTPLQTHFPCVCGRTYIDMCSYKWFRDHLKAQSWETITTRAIVFCFKGGVGRSSSLWETPGLSYILPCS